MTVKELKRELENYSEDYEVSFTKDNELFSINYIQEFTFLGEKSILLSSNK